MKGSVMLKDVRGFTLVEMVVVVGILAILTALSVPNFISWRQNAQYKEAAQLAFTKFREARERAININQRTRVTYNLDTQNVSINVVNPNGTLGDIVSSSEFIAGVDYKGWASATNDCSVTTGTILVTFNTDGSSNQRSICITAGIDRKYRVGISNSTTGRIVLERWADGAWK